MVTMNVQVGLDLDFVCVQCKQAMKLEAPRQPGVMAVLKCVVCGFTVQVQPGKPRPGTPDLKQRMPAFRPAPKA